MSALLKPHYPAAPNGHIRWGQLYGSSLDWLIAQSAQGFDGLLLLVVPDVHTAYQMESALQFFAPEIPRHIFPDWETLPYDVFSPHEDIISERLKTLATLAKSEARHPDCTSHHLAAPACTHQLCAWAHLHRAQRLSRSTSPNCVSNSKKQATAMSVR